MKKQLFLPVLCLMLALCACSSTDDEAMTIELASPKLKVTTELATATVTWDAIPKTAGYAYVLDNAAEYTAIEADKTSVTLTKLAQGSHTFRIKAVGDLSHTTDSADRSIDFEIDPTLAQPKPSYVKGDQPGSVIISWQAVKGAAGYAYKFNDAASWTRVGADVLTITQTGLDSEQTVVFRMYAVGQLPDSSDSEPVELSFKLVDTSKGVWARMTGGELYELTENPSNVFTGTIPCAAADSFEVLIQNVAYGFLSYSGNGGVGTVNSAQACVPFYSYPAAGYYVRSSIGRMSADEPLNKFWINLPAASQIEVRIDCSQEPHRYGLRLVEAEDPALVLAQYFDLMVLGSDWVQTGQNKPNGRMSSASNNSASLDGTEAGDKTISANTTYGALISSETASPEYIANRGLTGWEIAYCYEFPGYIRLSNTATPPQYGIITTPKLTALSEPTTVTLTFDAVRFASTADIPVKVLGAGTIRSASVRIEGGTAETAITPSSDGTSIAITSTHCPKHANTVLKDWSCFTLTIQGATADTRISWDTTGAGTGSNEGRICLDNIVIRKS